ncbi:MAG TPA: autotransporter assembly complex family protein [Phenylobacterium sp.]
MVVAAVVVAAFCIQLTAGPAQAAEPRAALQGEMDEALRQAIVRAVGEIDRPALNRFEARRRAREAAESAISVLRSEGYYGYEVTPDVGEGDTPTSVVRVTPGRRFLFAGSKVDWVGDPPSPTVSQSAAEAMGLADGAPGRSIDVLAAEGRVVATVQKLGYADAATEPREVVVDHADRTVRPTFRIAAGQLVRLDGLELTTQGRTSPVWLKNLAPWRPGEVYKPNDVAELERRLLDTQVYDSVTVALAPREKTTADGLRPIVVSLADRKPRTIEAGASYATSEGLGLDVKWTRYSTFLRADTLAYTARVSQLDSRLAADLSLPHWRRPQQTLHLGAAAYKTTTDAYDETGFGVRSDVTRRYGKTSYITVGASADLSRNDEKRPETLSSLGRDIATLALLADLSLDRSDDPLDPHRGWRVGARAEPTYLVGRSLSLPYLKLVAQGSYYLSVDKQARTVLAARVRAGEILGGTIPEVPASRRFYAGGGGSVRGYAYQAVGPRLSDNTPQGGLSLLETSVELRQKLTRRWGVVAFVDAGAVGTGRFPGGSDLSAGAGLGVRYDLGFGPFRADIAVPLNKRQGDSAFQIYMSIGQSF